MENKFKLLATLIKDFEIQCSFWALWTKSRAKTSDFREASKEAGELFESFVEYWQGKTGNQFTFVDTTFEIDAFKANYFLWLDGRVHEIIDEAETMDFIWFTQKFKEIYFKLRGLLND